MQTFVTFTALAVLAAAAPMPSRTINERAGTSQCAQYASVTAGAYTLNNDLWGEDNGSGSQCFTLDSSSGDSLGWSTSWSWSGGTNDVKSYANAVYGFTATQLSGISSIPSKWEWSYTGGSIVADVSYDLFTSSSASGSEEYEIMIWLAALGGAGPISASYGADGKAVSIGSTTVGGSTFDLYKGTNGIQTATYSFIATEEVTSFSGDINDFLKFLVSSESFDSSQYLVSLGAGTEAFTGSDAVFTVSSYSVDVETGSSGSTPSSSAAPSSTAAPTSATSAPASTYSAAPTTAVTSTSTTPSSVIKPASYTAPTLSSAATSVAPVSTSASSSSAPTSYVAPTSSSAATSVGALSTAASSSAAATYPPYPTGGYTAPLAPTGTSSPYPGCEVEYVYV